MKEGAKKTGGWKGLPFYTRVTIAALLVFALIYKGINISILVLGGVDVGGSLQGIVFDALFMIPTLVAAIWALLMLLIIAPTIPNALGAFNSFFDTGLLIPAIV